MNRRLQPTALPPVISFTSQAVVPHTPTSPATSSTFVELTHTVALAR